MLRACATNKYQLRDSVSRCLSPWPAVVSNAAPLGDPFTLPGTAPSCEGKLTGTRAALIPQAEPLLNPNPEVHSSLKVVLDTMREQSLVYIFVHTDYEWRHIQRLSRTNLRAHKLEPNWNMLLMSEAGYTHS